ncbi:hypothetical protein JCM10207_002358 [Rhodosporidiobolus poonsookiae]
MFTAQGFTVQLLIANHPQTPLSLIDVNSGASLARFAFAYAVGTPWLIAWKAADAATAALATTGSLYVSQDGSEGVVGTAAFKPGDHLHPTLQGTFNSTGSPWTLTLVIEGIGRFFPLAVFTLSCENTLPLSPPSSSPAKRPRLMSAGSSDLDKPVPVSSTVTLSLEEYHTLKDDLGRAEQQAEWFEQKVSTLYDLLPLDARVRYLSHRLMHESLAPIMRVSVGLDLRVTEKKLQDAREEAVRSEFGGMLAAVCGKERKEKESGGETGGRNAGLAFSS